MPKKNVHLQSRLNRKIIFAHFVLIVLFANIANSSAQTPFSISPFSFSLSKTQLKSPGQWVATLTIAVSKNHYLYREKTQIESEKAHLEISWPPSSKKFDPFESKEIEVFDSGVHEIGLSVSEIGSLTNVPIKVAYQGCSSITCFMPDEKILIIEEPKEKIASDFNTSLEQISSKSTSEKFALVSNESVSTETSKFSSYFTSTAENENQQTKSVQKTFDGQVITPVGPYDFNQTLKEKGLLWGLLLAFIGGFLVSLTPCVYPMIPITLSIIGGRRENTTFRNAFVLSLVYVLGMSITYALLGLIVALFGAQVRALLQGALFQLVIAAIFVLLALSMFDMVLLQAPESLRNRITRVQYSGLGGVFLLGMLSGLMASPCVAAPLAGILAFIAATGNLLFGFTMLMAFAWGMGLILVLIGAFSGAINALPKAGDWMIKVKEFYGFLLLGAALYFAHPFIGASATGLLIGLLLAAFAGFLGLFGPVSAENTLAERVSRCIGVVVLAIGSAFAINSAEQWSGISGKIPSIPIEESAAQLMWNDSIEEGLALAAREKKPVFIDFRADWCSVCKDLEKNVFTHSSVKSLLKNYVIVKFDATNSTPSVKQWLERFGIFGLPTLVFLDQTGDELKELRVIGEVGVDDLIKRLRQGLLRYKKSSK